MYVTSTHIAYVVGENDYTATSIHLLSKDNLKSVKMYPIKEFKKVIFCSPDRLIIQSSSSYTTVYLQSGEYDMVNNIQCIKNVRQTFQSKIQFVFHQILGLNFCILARK
jgi:hypothetical protein